MEVKYTEKLALIKAMGYSFRSEIVGLLKANPNSSRASLQEMLGLKLPHPLHRDIRFLVDANMIECTNAGAFTPLYKITERGSRYLNYVIHM